MKDQWLSFFKSQWLLHCNRLRLCLITLCLLLASCQLGYIIESGYYQADLLRQRVPLQYALDNYQLTNEQKEKIKLAIDLRKFMAEELGLDTENNYSRYVHLDRNHVSYAVNAAQKSELKAYTWSFPIIGSVPYKAYFKKDSAKEEQKKLQALGLDTHLRGVSAYSTLGWFEDPLLSSMLGMKEHHFVNTLIHETVHANLYIKNQSKFNERVASFLGQLGAEAYYNKSQRKNELAKIVSAETHDELLFSEFISKEIKKLRNWYKQNKNNPKLLEMREQQFNTIKDNFSKNVLPNLKTQNYKWLIKSKLNNAFLLLLELYNSDFSDFEIIANRHKRNFKFVFEQLKKLEDSDDPEETLKSLVTE